MGLAIASRAQYENAIKKLFPQGDYWDEQFADPTSDVSLFCQAKAEEMFRFRGRMANLQSESVVSTAEETLADWERVLKGTITTGLEPDDRRALLMAQDDEKINLSSIQIIGKIYGWDITKITFPLRPAFFGFSHFGHDRIAGPAAFSAINIYVAGGEETARSFMENKLAKSLLANYIINFIYEGEN
jgi:hypothetical protein